MPALQRYSILASFVLLFHSPQIIAEPAIDQIAEPDVVIPVPDGLQNVDNGPDVRLIEKDDLTISEYRVGGRLYMVKFQPKGAPAYYMVDSNGDGLLDARQTEMAAVPMWLLFSW